MSLKFLGSAPSNIALVKYMGKTTTSTNVPTNASLSYTLEHLRSFVELAVAGEDRWEPLPGFAPIELNENGLAKFSAHLERLRQAWGVTDKFLVRSANNFPSDCGLASSASSFAALTEAVYAYSRAATGREVGIEERSKISRLGSGSSCRSFFTPWAEWRGAGAFAVKDLSLRLEHAVVVVSETAKAVSSSRAHVLVTGSPRFVGRPERAEARLSELHACLKDAGGWRRAFEICHEEFEDMHQLFETSTPAFSYRDENTRRVVDRLLAEWKEFGDGPLITMDAGPNVHVLLRVDQTARADEYLKPFRTIKSWGFNA